MKKDYNIPMVVQMAEEILDMHYELESLRSECAELRQYREKYIKEIDRGIKHSQHMIGGLLELVMTPGVLDVVGAANERA